ncbi:hypothetical protein V8D89_012117 [Ganoderma adspersum]
MPSVLELTVPIFFFINVSKGFPFMSGRTKFKRWEDDSSRALPLWKSAQRVELKAGDLVNFLPPKCSACREWSPDRFTLCPQCVTASSSAYPMKRTYDYVRVISLAYPTCNPVVTPQHEAIHSPVVPLCPPGYLINPSLNARGRASSYNDRVMLQGCTTECCGGNTGRSIAPRTNWKQSQQQCSEKAFEEVERNPPEMMFALDSLSQTAHHTRRGATWTFVRREQQEAACATAEMLRRRARAGERNRSVLPHRRGDDGGTGREQSGVERGVWIAKGRTGHRKGREDSERSSRSRRAWRRDKNKANRQGFCAGTRSDRGWDGDQACEAGGRPRERAPGWRAPDMSDTSSGGSQPVIPPRKQSLERERSLQRTFQGRISENAALAESGCRGSMKIMQNQMRMNAHDRRGRLPLAQDWLGNIPRRRTGVRAKPTVSRATVPSSSSSIWMVDTDRLEELGLVVGDILAPNRDVGPSGLPSMGLTAKSSPSKDRRPTNNEVIGQQTGPGRGHDMDRKRSGRRRDGRQPEEAGRQRHKMSLGNYPQLRRLRGLWSSSIRVALLKNDMKLIWNSISACRGSEKVVRVVPCWFRTGRAKFPGGNTRGKAELKEVGVTATMSPMISCPGMWGVLYEDPEHSYHDPKKMSYLRQDDVVEP